MAIACGAVLALAGCGGGSARDNPNLTPEGAATLWSPWLGGATLVGYPPSVLTRARIRVGRGGKDGWVRVRVAPRGREARALVGPWVHLSAKPGVYRLPAPRITYDYREVVIGLDQRSGGLAIVHHEACDPKQGEGADPCQIMALQVHRPILPIWVRPVAADAQEVLRGRQLRITGINPRDLDLDLSPDRTEDRTDLRVDAHIARFTATSVTVAVAVSNRGARAADLPRLDLVPSAGVGLGVWRGCRHDTTTGRQQVFERDIQGAPGEDTLAVECTLETIPAGFDHTVRGTLPRVGPAALRFSAAAEGPDTHAGDNAATVQVQAPLRAAVVVVPARLDYRHLRLRVDSARSGPVVVRLRRRGRTLWERRVVFGAPGTRELRVNRRFPSRLLRATATVAGGPSTVGITYGG